MLRYAVFSMIVVHMIVDGVSPSWLCHPVGCVTQLAVSPSWLCHPVGCVTQLAVSPSWLAEAKPH